MDLYGLVFLALYALAVARVTRLLTDDVILEPARIAIQRRFGPEGMIGYFVTCPWCVSVWVVAATVWLPVIHLGLEWWLVFLVGPAASYLTGFGASVMGPDDVEVTIDGE